MLPEISILSLAAALLYLVVYVSCGTAMLVARNHAQPRWHVNAWALLLAIFMLLMLVRFFDVEATLQDALREALREQHNYESRRDFQRPMAAGMLIVIAIAMFWAVYRLAHMARTLRGRRNMAVLGALTGAVAMLFLIGFRMISLSPVDKLLYGPLKLNWVGDIGASLTVLGASAFYVWVVSKPGQAK